MRCKFDNKCYNRGTCTRFHTGQTMDEYIAVNRFVWPEKKKTSPIVEETSSSTSEKCDDSFVIQIDDDVSVQEDLTEIEREMNEVCDEIDILAYQEEFLNEVDRLGADIDFEHFVDYNETLRVYQKTLEKLHDEYQYAHFIREYMQIESTVF
jgi:hypothetical protein